MFIMLSKTRHFDEAQEMLKKMRAAGYEAEPIACVSAKQNRKNRKQRNFSI